MLFKNCSILIVILCAVVLASCNSQMSLDNENKTPIKSMNDKDNILPSDFYIQYTDSSAIRGYELIKTINSNGSFELTKRDLMGKVEEIEVGVYSEDKLIDIYNFILDNDFFSLPEDLTITSRCPGGSYEYYEVKMNGEAHKIEGACIQDKVFRNFVEKVN